MTLRERYTDNDLTTMDAYYNIMIRHRQSTNVENKMIIKKFKTNKNMYFKVMYLFILNILGIT